MDIKKHKKGQIAIFVIIALIIVVAVALVFIFVGKPFDKISPIEDPKGYVSQCVQEPLSDGIEQVIMHGGYLNAEEPSILYENEDVAYLCHTPNNEEICIAIEPMLIEKIEEEILAYITQPVEGCLDELEQSLALYSPKIGDTKIDVEIMPEQVLVKINKDVSYTKDQQTQNFEVFDTIISSPLHDFARITNNIINEEIDCDCGRETCNADVFNVAETHDFEVERFVTGRNEKIYTIREIVSEDEFIFAIRNCVRLPY